MKLDSIDNSIEEKVNELSQVINIKKLLEELPSEVLDALPNGYIFQDRLDFDYLSHDKVMLVIKTFKAGKWTKIPREQDASVDYETEIGDIRIRCYAGEEPANCRIIRLLCTETL